jgi:hypothetical protein
MEWTNGALLLHARCTHPSSMSCSSSELSSAASVRGSVSSAGAAVPAGESTTVPCGGAARRCRARAPPVTSLRASAGSAGFWRRLTLCRSSMTWHVCFVAANALSTWKRLHFWQKRHATPSKSTSSARRWCMQSLARAACVVRGCVGGEQTTRWDLQPALQG